MEIVETKIKIKDLYDGYVNNDEEGGVIGYGGNLDIRPKYQREFVYNSEQQKEVIKSILKNFPLNVFYWVDRGDKAVQEGLARYEVLDGQQRTLSICEYLNNNFSVDGMLFANQPNDIKENILNYELFVYICYGTESEKLEWFKIINIAGEKLKDQEMRNAVYAGSWVSDAKKYFSKSSGPAYGLASNYLDGTANRQDYLETAIKWHANIDNLSIEDYMGIHQHEKDASALWIYFIEVIEWINKTFPKYRREMKGIDWGILYNQHSNRSDLDPIILEQKVAKLMADEDVTSKKGIYEYLLTGKEKILNIRSFDQRDKRTIYEKQKGICPYCMKSFKLEEMHGDHIIPWSRGGETKIENLQMLCTECNIKKSKGVVK